jgi:hypothetical protein
VICVRALAGPGETREVAAGTDESSRTPKFGVGDGFYVELRRRVETFFRTTGRRQRDCWQLYLKTGILVAVWVTSYLLLVRASPTERSVAAGRSAAPDRVPDLRAWGDTAVERRVSIEQASRRISRSPAGGHGARRSAEDQKAFPGLIFRFRTRSRGGFLRLAAPAGS